MLQSLATRLGAVTVVLVCTYAIFGGSWRERFSAFVYLTGYMMVLGFGLAGPNASAIYMLASDTLSLLGFFIASWKSAHSWPRWAIAGQLTSVILDVVALTGLFNRRFFLTMETVTAYAVLLALLVGTIAYRSERRATRSARQTL